MEDWDYFSVKKEPQTPASSSHRNLYCDGCGGREFHADEDDGFYYCTECGSQSQQIIQTAIAEEDFLSAGGIYNHRYTRTQSQNPNPNHKSKDQVNRELDQIFGVHALKTPKVENFVGFDDDEVSEPRDFGSVMCSDKEKLADGLRLRYVEGLQVMVQRQCEVLVEKFGVSPYIVGVVGSIWLKYVAATRVLADDWPEKAIKESEEAAKAAGRAQVVKEEKPSKFKRARCTYRSEPKNLYGQKAIYLWLRSLKRTLPLYSTLAISFLACHIAREPILPTDIFKWASEGKLPYLSAFTYMDRCLGNSSDACPLNSIALFRPNQIIGPGNLEAAAASIAQTIGLRLPSVNFYAIAHRYLKELYLPVEKILPHACKIYEWAIPAELWLSSNVCGFPTRACVMSILIVTMRLLYNIQGQGIWETSQFEVRNPNSQNQGVADSKNLNSVPENVCQKDDSKKPCEAGDSKPAKKLLRIQASDYNYKELLSILEVAYDKINTAHDYSKDLLSYLKHCKDVIFAGTSKSYEEERLIERLWDMYEKQENDGAKDEKKPKTEVSPNTSSDPNKGNEDISENTTQMEEDIIVKKHLTQEPFSFLNNPVSSVNIAVEKMKLEMEENGFEYLPPRSLQKIDLYLHYKRQRVDGKLVYVAHADYYMLLRACAKLAELDAQTMHRSVLSLERRLEWLDKKIDELF